MLAAILVVSAVAVPMALARGSKTVAGKAAAPSLHKTVLTNTKGMTLYTASVSRRTADSSAPAPARRPGRRSWVAAGNEAEGPVTLGTIKRPEGKIQVTFKGLPLYTFDGDSKKGEANGEGIKDVGTWHAVTP